MNVSSIRIDESTYLFVSSRGCCGFLYLCKKLGAMNPIIWAATIDYGEETPMSLRNMAMPSSSTMAEAMRGFAFVIEMLLEPTIFAD